MPKVKTNSSAKKRFKVTGTGKIMHQKAFKRHILTKKSKKRKRNMRLDGTVAKSHVDFVKRLPASVIILTFNTFIHQSVC